MDHAVLIERYLAGSEAVREVVGGFTAEQLRARPVAGMWSPLEVVCHLADSEALFADRMKRVLAEDRPALPFADPQRYVQALAYSEREVGEEVAVLEGIRRQMGRILRAQAAAAWQRVGVHSKEGERTLEQLVSKAIDHLEHHVRTLWAKRQAQEGGGGEGEAAEQVRGDRG